MILSFLTDRSKAAYRIYFILLVAFITLFVGLLAKTGCSHQDDGGWDTILFMDSAYRMHTGQMPHVDYMSPIGIVPIWLTYLGMKIGGVNANGPAFGSAVGLIFVGLFAWLVSARRLPGLFAFLFSLFIGALFIATRPLPFMTVGFSFEFFHTSYAMWYNRIGWSLLVILALHSFITPYSQNSSALVSDFESFLAGSLIPILALTKVNYLAAALGISLVGVFVTRPNLRQLFWYALGVVCFPVLLMTCTRFSLQAWMRDMAVLAQLADVHGRQLKLVQCAFGNLTDIAFALAVLVLLWPFCGSLKDAWKDAGMGRIVLAFGACMGVGMVVLALNSQIREVPLFPVACVVILESVLRRWKSDPQGEPVAAMFRLRFITGTCFFLFLLMSTFISDAGSVVYSWAYKSHMRFLTPASGLIQSESLGQMLLPPLSGEQVEKPWVISDLVVRKDFSPHMAWRSIMTPYEYAHLINDGLELIKPHVTPSSRIFCMDLVNPFPFALLTPYPKGGILWWDRQTFSQKIHPQPEQVFAEVTHVMEPKIVVRLNELLDIYGPYVNEHFDRVAESPLWVLYERKNITPEQGH